MHLKCRTNCFCPLSPPALKAGVAVVTGAAVRTVHVRICGRRCRASAGCPESTVLLRCRPAGCGRPARNPLRPERGSSRSARGTNRIKRWASQYTDYPWMFSQTARKLPKTSCDCAAFPDHPSMLKLIFFNRADVFSKAQSFSVSTKVTWIVILQHTHMHTIIHIKQISAPQAHCCNALNNKRK